MCDAVVDESIISFVIMERNDIYSAKEKSDEAMLIEEDSEIKCISMNSKDEVEDKVGKPTKVQKRRSKKIVDADNSSYEFGLRMPAEGIRCAGRKGNNQAQNAVVS
jgi:hypothetical protein